MADIPVYQPSIPINSPGTPRARIEPMTPASSPAEIYEAQAGLGKQVEEVSSKLRTHMLMQDHIEAQQDGYDAAAKYNQKLQDVVAEEKQNNTGMNAKGGEVRLKQLIDGIPASPGRPGVPPLRAEFASKLSPLALKSFERTADAHETVAHGQIINHVLTQTNKAMEQNSTAEIGTQIDHGNNIHFPAEMKAAQEKFGKIIDDDLWLKREHTPEDLAKMKQGFLDKQAEAAITARAHEDYKTAQKLFDSAKDGLSPGMRTHLQETVIDAAKVNQFSDAGTQSVLKNSTLRNPETMQVDEGKAFTAIQKMVAKEKLPAGHDMTVIDRIFSNVKAENSRLDSQEKDMKDSAILGIQKLSQDPNATLADAENKFVKTAKFMRGQTFAEVDDFARKAFTKDPMTGEMAWDSAPKPVRDVFDMKKAEIETKMYGNDRKQFEAVAKRRLLDSGVRTQDQAIDIMDSLLKKVPTKSPLFTLRGHSFGDGSKKEYEAQQKLMDTETAKTLGMDKSAKAVRLILQHGYPMNEEILKKMQAKPGLL